MRKDRWAELEELFHSALAREGRERESFLRQTRESDPELAREIASLLEAHERQQMVQACEQLFAADLPPLWPGDRAGLYEIVRLLGEGGGGRVYLATDRRLGRNVALKLLRASTAVADAGITQFQREARAASALNHPGILTVYETGEFDGRLYIASEFVDGLTVRERLLRSRQRFRISNLTFK